MRNYFLCPNYWSTESWWYPCLDGPILIQLFSAVGYSSFTSSVNCKYLLVYYSYYAAILLDSIKCMRYVYRTFAVMTSVLSFLRYHFAVLSFDSRLSAYQLHSAYMRRFRRNNSELLRCPYCGSTKYINASGLSCGIGVHNYITIPVPWDLGSRSTGTSKVNLPP